MRAHIEPWVRPAMLLGAVALLLAIGPAGDRVRAGLMGNLPYPGVDRLVVFTLYPPVGEGTGQIPSLAKSLEQQAAFREVPLFRPEGGIWGLEATPNLDAVLGPVPRSFVFPQARIALPWRDRPYERVMLLARLKPGVSMTAARDELRRDPAYSWVKAQSLANRSLNRPFFAMLFWMVPILLAVRRLIQDMWHDRRLAGYRLYALLYVLALALFFVTLSVVAVEFWSALFPVVWKTVLFAFVVIAWLLATPLALLLWKQDVDNRCRRCLGRLRLPLQEGEWGALLVRPENVHSFCPWGHGQLVVDRLDAHWTFGGDLWEELVECSKR